MNYLSIEGGRLEVPAPGAAGVRVYKGIPFAAAPVGRLRWRPPEPVLPWDGVRPAGEFGPNSLQGVVFDDIDPLAVGVSEDCLYLNVWTPAEPEDPDDCRRWSGSTAAASSSARAPNRAMTARASPREELWS